MNKKTKSLIIMSLLLVASISFTSCSTLFTGTKDRITFNTNPPGARVYINGIEQGVTPLTMKVKRSLNDTDAEFKLDGYETRLITLSKGFNVVSVINLGNLLGWGIDALSGSIMKYDQRSYDITLDDKKVAEINPNRINIDTENNIVELFVTEK